MSMGNTRSIAGRDVPAIGLGCMNISHAYGSATEGEGMALLEKAYDLGVRHFDTAALYGHGKNETLVGKVIKPFREDIQLASKCGMTGVNGKKVIDGRPDTLLATLDDALVRLQTDHIDLYYLHRLDPNVPIEESVGALATAVSSGKIGAIGLSEVSAATIRRAHNVHPLAAVQSEYSLWTRNPEIAVLDTCRELGISLVAFSPLTRGFLTGAVTSQDQLVEGDIRRTMPRFQPPHIASNLKLLVPLKEIAAQYECSLAQLCLAWCLAKGDDILPIPGTRSVEHLEDNLGALRVILSQESVAELDHLVNASTVSGPRYPEAQQTEIDTEQF